MTKSRCLVSALLCGAATLAACSATDRPGGELRERIAQRDWPTSFAMEYHATGTEVAECFLPNRAFAIDVRDDEVVVRDVEEPRAALAQRVGSALQLAPALFEAGPLQQRWLTVDVAVLDEADRITLTKLLGAHLASYLLTDVVPPNGPEIATAVLDAATDVEARGAETVNGRPADRFRIALDPERYAEAQPASPSTVDAPDASPPVVDIWVDDDDQVVQVAVSPDAGTSEQTRGWVIGFDDAASAEDPGPVATVPLVAIDLGTLSVAIADCEI